MPISKAVSASTALPMVYRPVDIKGRQFIDGGIRSTTNVDIAVEQGAKFIVVVNPLVPYVNDFQKRIPTIFGSRVRRVSDMGYPQVGYQAFKLLAHARLHEHVKHWKERYPGVDIILIEPDPNDELMFGTSMMNYSSRLEIARHGFESVTMRLAAGLPPLQARSARSTASRSPPGGSRRSSARPKSSPRRRPRGGGSSSRRPARCYASRATPDLTRVERSVAAAVAVARDHGVEAGDPWSSRTARTRSFGCGPRRSWRASRR